MRTITRVPVRFTMACVLLLSTTTSLAAESAPPVPTPSARDIPNPTGELGLREAVAAALVGSPELAAFSYDVRGSDLPRNATLGLYWAAGERFEDILGPAIFSLPTERAVGGHGPIGVDRSILDLTPRPQGTTHLLLALDPPDANLPVGEIAELSESNNVLAIPVLPPVVIDLRIDAASD